MPLTSKGEEIKKAMEEQYGKEKGEQVFYASANKGTITGTGHGDKGLGLYDEPEKEEDCGDQAGPQAPLVMPPEPSPREEGLEHPQLHPDASTPPSSADQPVKRSAYGGISGGINPQGAFGQPSVQVWGDRHDQAMQASPRSELSQPSLSLAELQTQNEEFWRPHGVAPGPYRDRRRGGSFRR